MPLYAFLRTFNAPEILALDWAELEIQSGLTFSDAQRQTLLVALNHYLSEITYTHVRPAIKTVKRQLQEIEQFASALVPLLDKPQVTGLCPDQIEQAFALYEAILHECFPFEHVDPPTFVRTLVSLAQGASKALAKIRSVNLRGRPPRVGLRTLISAWHRVYQDIGGSGIGAYWFEDASQHEGPLLELLDGALRQAAMQVQTLPTDVIRPSRNELGQVIIRTLGARRAARRTDENAAP